jgi:hypothetical protein
MISLGYTIINFQREMAELRPAPIKPVKVPSIKVTDDKPSKISKLSRSREFQARYGELQKKVVEKFQMVKKRKMKGV